MKEHQLSLHKQIYQIEKKIVIKKKEGNDQINQ